MLKYVGVSGLVRIAINHGADWGEPGGLVACPLYDVRNCKENYDIIITLFGYDSSMQYAYQRECPSGKTSWN